MVRKRHCADECGLYIKCFAIASKFPSALGGQRTGVFDPFFVRALQTRFWLS